MFPPVFFIQDSYKQRRIHWLLPLYLRDNNMAKGEAWTSIMPALYVQHRSLEHNNAVQFPILWHFDNPKRRVTIGGFSGTTSAASERGVTTQVLPAIYARRETSEQVGHMIGPGLATWRREAEGQPPALHWRALFWIVGGGNEGGSATCGCSAPRSSSSRSRSRRASARAKRERKHKRGGEATPASE